MTEVSLADRKTILNQTIGSLQSRDIDNETNFKFMNLLRSRLLEEGIPMEAATLIVSTLDYDLSAVNEDDDYVGDVALSYAEYVAKIYARLTATNWHRNLTADVVRKYINVTKITL